MKKYFQIFLSLCIYLFFISLAQALPEPKKCPSVSSFQTVNFIKAEQREDRNRAWLGFQYNNVYDTDEKWDFIMSGAQAKDEQEAIQKLTAAIGLLFLWQGPVGDDNGYAWICLYNSKSEEFAGIAITPAGLDSKYKKSLLK